MAQGHHGMSIQKLQSKLNHSEMKVRSETVSFLLEMSNHEAYGLLMYAAGNHFSPETRREAKKASLILQKSLFPSLDQKSSKHGSIDQQTIDKFKSGDSSEKLKILDELIKSENSKLFDSLLDLLHQEQDPEILPKLIWTCANLGKISSIPHITNFLRSGNPTVRASVVRSLAFIEDPKNYPLLVRFTRDPDEKVRKESLKAVANLPAEPLLQCLTQMAKKDSDFHRDATIFVIARLAFEPGFKLLISLTQSESDVIQQRSKMALEYLQKKGILKTDLEAQTTSPNSAQKKVENEDSQAEIKSTDPNDDAINKESAPEHTADLEEQMGSTNSELDEEEENHIRVIRQGEEASAIKSVFALIESNRLSRLDELKSSVVERSSKRLTATFIMALAQSKDKKHKDFLKECLQNSDDRVQANSIEALRMLGCEDLKTELLPFLAENIHDRARANAIIFLHPTGLIDTRQELENMLSSKNDNRKLSAIFAIMDLFDPSFIVLLEAPIDSPNPKVTKRAIEALKLFVLDKQESAIKIAEKWKILDEMTPDKVEEELEKSDQSEDETEQSSMDDLMSDLKDGVQNTPDKSESEKVQTKDISAEEETKGFARIKSFMSKFLKK